MNSAKVRAALEEAMMIDGALGVCLVDYQSGMTLGTAGGNGMDLEMAAAGNTEVVRSKMRVMGALGLQDRIEDMLITLGSQYHLIRMVKGAESLFLYLALNKGPANLGLAKYQLSGIEQQLRARQ
jgi:hypothetical protein